LSGKSVEHRPVRKANAGPTGKILGFNRLGVRSGGNFLSRGKDLAVGHNVRGFLNLYFSIIYNFDVRIGPRLASTVKLKGRPQPGDPEKETKRYVGRSDYYHPFRRVVSGLVLA
jgi:hypothetical protein